MPVETDLAWMRDRDALHVFSVTNYNTTTLLPVRKYRWSVSAINAILVLGKAQTVQLSSPAHGFIPL